MIINKDVFIIAKNSVDYSIQLEKKLKELEKENARLRDLFTDYGKLVRLLNEFGVEYKEYTDPDFIDDPSVKAGTVLCVCIRDSVNINFDANYNFVSSSTDQRNSTIFRKQGKEE
jgi:hypothetical protein